MNLRIRRRRFGQLAIASAATAAIANLGSKAVAQQSEVILGVRLGKSSGGGGLLGGIVSSITDLANNTPAITLITSDLVSGREISVIDLPSIAVDNISTVVETVAKAATTALRERITGLTTLSDNTLVIASVSQSRNGNVTRLVFSDPSSSRPKNSLKLSGFPTNNSTVESILSTNDNNLLSVISLNNAITPFDFASIDPRTGRVTPGAELALPAVELDRRYSNLASSPDGTIYATTLGREGVTTLVQVDLENRLTINGRGRINRLVPLSFENEPLENDLLSLAFSRSGQLYALANPNYEATNSLFSVDPRSGVLTLLRKFDASKITFPK
ncbi:hypothetical protein [Iningainema tapete]|uniref:Uncharacterized protein n=1 Tax=Iningainema tapete BLCC-T55 TaxID=2748662 RepID=A0A8J6XIH4_9CYAN|nr:hypothetical protein [Iningainema tapete]MBD2772976.1 hypothetical protein [Iningainema tapete BLCC-T55]